MTQLTIGQLAEAAGVGVQTVRYDERKGLIPAPPRSDSGYRQYPVCIVDRIRFIRRAKSLGFTLRDIQRLLEDKSKPDATCQEIRERVSLKIEDLETTIAELRSVLAQLEELRSGCEGAKSLRDCPVIGFLEEDR